MAGPPGQACGCSHGAGVVGLRGANRDNGVDVTVFTRLTEQVDR
jgi:hypothetical protein